MPNTTEIDKSTIAAEAYMPEANPEFYCFFDNEGNVVISHVKVYNDIRAKRLVINLSLKWYSENLIL